MQPEFAPETKSCQDEKMQRRLEDTTLLPFGTASQLHQALAAEAKALKPNLSGWKPYSSAIRCNSKTALSASDAAAPYCLSNTATLLYFLPLASVPLTVTVRLLPSADTTM